MARGRDKFKKFRKLIRCIEGFYGLFPRGMQLKMFIALRKKPGTMGLVLRYALLRNLAAHVGENVSIHPDVYLFNVDKLSIGDNVSIQPMSYIEAWGGIEIGNDVAIAHGVTIMSVNHGFESLDMPIKDQPIIPMPVKIGDDVWLASKVSVLGGTTVGDHSVIGAGAVVTGDIAPRSVAVGVPAKVIKTRG